MINFFYIFQISWIIWLAFPNLKPCIYGALWCIFISVFKNTNKTPTLSYILIYMYSLCQYLSNPPPLPCLPQSPRCRGTWSLQFWYILPKTAHYYYLRYSVNVCLVTVNKLRTFSKKYTPILHFSFGWRDGRGDGIWIF